MARAALSEAAHLLNLTFNMTKNNRIFDNVVRFMVKEYLTPQSKLKAVPITQDEVKAALARERRPGVRRRLVALSRILAGKSIKQAARAAKATRGSVERWLKQVRQAGLQSLPLDRRRRYRKREMTRAQVENTRREIAAALAHPLRPQVRARLIAIDTVLSGRPINEVAV